MKKESKKIESEKLIEKKLVKKVKALGGMCIKGPANYMQGFPDREVLMPGGKVYFVELKTTGEKPRVIQEVVMGKLRRLGFEVRVIDSSDGINEFIEYVKRN